MAASLKQITMTLEAKRIRSFLCSVISTTSVSSHDIYSVKFRWFGSGTDGILDEQHFWHYDLQRTNRDRNIVEDIHEAAWLGLCFQFSLFV